MGASPPIILEQPEDQAVVLGGHATFHVLASGMIPLNYQWRKDGANIEAATSVALLVSWVAQEDVAGYSVVVANALGAVTSRLARLEMFEAPVIVQAPVTHWVVEGGDVTFSVEITGNPPPFTYQWRRMSPFGVLASKMVDHTIDFFALPAVTPSDAGQYQVLAQKNNRTASALFTLQLLPDSDGDRLPDVSIPDPDAPAHRVYRLVTPRQP